MCFLVNIELGRAPKKMQISFPKGGRGQRGGTKKHAFFWSIFNWDHVEKIFIFFLLKGKGGGVEEGRRSTSGED